MKFSLLLSLVFMHVFAVNCSCITSRDELNRLVYDCTDQFLPSFPSDLPNNTQVLILRRSMLNPIIPSFQSIGLAGLQVLDLSSNKISYLAKDTFKGMKSLLILDLRRNNVLTTLPIPRGLFADLTKVNTLKIKGGIYNKEVLEQLVGEIKSLTSLTSLIYQYGYAKMAASIVGQLPQLTSVEFHRVIFDYEFQSDFILNLRNLKKLEALSIRASSGLVTLGSKVLNWTTNLKHLNLACNQELSIIDTIRYLGNQTSLSNIKTLILDHTNNDHFGKHVPFRMDASLFCNLSFSSSLERLSLQRLGFFSIDSAITKCITTLRSLNFGHNIPYISDCESDDSCYKSLVAALSSVQFIKASNLMITRPTKDTYCTDDISLNFDEYFIDEKIFSNSSDCKSLKDIKQNEHVKSQYIQLPPCLRAFQFDYFYRTESVPPPFKLNFSSNNSLELLDLSDTIWNPNGLALDTIQFNGFYKLRIFRLRNALLSKFHMITISTNSLEQIDLSKNRFDQMTKLQLFNMFTRPMAKLQLLNLSASNIYELPSNFLWQFPLLEYLDLSFNKISEMTLNLSLVNLASSFTLNIASNQLSSINDSFMATADFLSSQRSVTVQLSNNQFRCDCDTLSFVRWFQSTRVIIKNKTNIQCSFNDAGNPVLVPISSINIAHLNSDCFAKQRILYISLGILSTGILISLCGGLYLYRQRYRIRWHWYNNKKKLCGIKSENLTEEHSHWQYSAYVNYWRVGGRWVMEELVKKIEDLRRGNAIIRGRDSNGGENVADFIMDAIIKSKKLVYVIGDDVKLGEERDWFQFSFYMALEQRKYSLSDFIFIIKNDIDYDDIGGTLLSMLCQPRTNMVMRIECNDSNRYWVNDLESIFNTGGNAISDDSQLIDISADNSCCKEDRESDEKLLKYC